jgi:hypothetical protein
MAKKAMVEGEVVLKDGNTTDIHFYEEEFILDDAVKTLAQARSIIQGGLINERLRRNMPNFRRVRTCQVIEFGETTEKPEASDLDKLLIEATELGCMPENIDNYKRPDYKIKALERAVQKAKERKAKPDNVQDLGYVD